MNSELEKLKEEAAECKKCELWKNRKNSVFGEGNENANIMLIGLGPGYQENETGRPFVGAAGKFLNKLLAYAGLSRENVYIANIAKCYLPDNKVTDKQVEICTKNYLDKQIKIINPKIIITLGNVSTEYIFKKFGAEISAIGKIHGKSIPVKNHVFNGKLIAMYHPSAALRNPGLRKTLEEDWKKIKAEL